MKRLLVATLALPLAAGSAQAATYPPVVYNQNTGGFQNLPADSVINGGSLGLPYGLAQGSLTLTSGGTGAAVGDAITLACPGTTFATSPVVTVNAVSGGAITGATVTSIGSAAKVPAGTCALTQASTTGSGSGAAFSGTFGLIASNLSFAGLSTGGAATNGNLFLGGETPSTAMGGSENTFVGDRAGGAFSGATFGNTAVGHDALGIFGGTTPTGGGNTGLGNDAGRNISSTAAVDTLIGQNAGRTISGSFDTLVGQDAGYQVGAGQGDTFIGTSAGYTCAGCSNNTIIGDNVGSTTLTTGLGDILIGKDSTVDTPASNTSNFLNVGDLLEGDLSHAASAASAVLYLQSVTSSVNYVGITSAITGSAPTVAPLGSDTNIALTIQGKGTGHDRLTSTVDTTVASSTSGADFNCFIPTDGVSSGHPELCVTKDVTANQWDISLYDGSGSSGVIRFAAASSTFSGTVTVTGLVTPPVNISALPASPAAGERAAVNNAAACVFNTGFTGTGSTFCPVVYNGSAWVGG